MVVYRISDSYWISGTSLDVRLCRPSKQSGPGLWMYKVTTTPLHNHFCQKNAHLHNSSIYYIALYTHTNQPILYEVSLDFFSR